MSFIILNGKKSSLIKGLLIQSLPPIIKPLIRTKTETIDGRDGDITRKLGYSAYDKQMSIGLFGDYDINEVIQYFDSEGIVIFSNEPDKFYKYKILQQINFEALLRFRTATVTFHCQPFKYSAVDESVYLTTNVIDINGFSQTLNEVSCETTRKQWAYSTPLDLRHVRINGVPTVQTEFFVPIQKVIGGYPHSASLDLIVGYDTNYFPLFPDTISVRLIRDNPTDFDSFGFGKIDLDPYVENKITGTLLNDYNYIWIQLQPDTRYKIDLYFWLYDTEIDHFDVWNKGNIESRPKLTIYGKNNITLKRNGTSLFDIALGNEEYIVIDGEEMNAYKGTTLKNRLVTGDYNNLTLRTGHNTFKWTGDVTAIKVENESRWI